MVVVWDLPLRVFHWALAAAVLIAWFSANVFDTVHEIAGYAVLVLIALRIVWGFTGTRHSRFRNFVRPPRVVLRYLWQIAHGQTGRYLGLNPAGAAMSVALLALLVVSTDQRLDADHGSASSASTGSRRCTPGRPTSVLILAVVHVLGVLLMCALQKENLVRAMITGRKRDRGE